MVTVRYNQLNAPFAEIETDLQWLFNTLTPGTVSIKLWIDTRWTGDVSINQTQNTTEYTQLEQDFEMDQSVEMEVVDVEQNVPANETKQDIKQVIPFAINIKSEKVEPDIKTDFKTNIPLDLNPTEPVNQVIQTVEIKRELIENNNMPPPSTINTQPLESEIIPNPIGIKSEQIKVNISQIEPNASNLNISNLNESSVDSKYEMAFVAEETTTINLIDVSQLASTDPDNSALNESAFDSKYDVAFSAQETITIKLDETTVQTASNQNQLVSHVDLSLQVDQTEQVRDSVTIKREQIEISTSINLDNLNESAFDSKYDIALSAQETTTIKLDEATVQSEQISEPITASVINTIESKEQELNSTENKARKTRFTNCQLNDYEAEIKKLLEENETLKLEKNKSVLEAESLKESLVNERNNFNGELKQLSTIITGLLDIAGDKESSKIFVPKHEPFDPTDGHNLESLKQRANILISKKQANIQDGASNRNGNYSNQNYKRNYYASNGYENSKRSFHDNSNVDQNQQNQRYSYYNQQNPKRFKDQRYPNYSRQDQR